MRCCKVVFCPEDLAVMSYRTEGNLCDRNMFKKSVLLIL